MTQMGLEYMKLQESQKHNRADEAIRERATDISQQEANTRSYSASFEPQRIMNDTAKAQAATRDADTRSRAQTQSEMYAERDMLQKEAAAAGRTMQGQAALQNAAIADRRYSADLLERDIAAREEQAAAATKQAEVAEARKAMDEFFRALEYASPGTSTVEAMKKLGYDDLSSYSSGFVQELKSWLPGLTQILRNVK